MDMYNVPFGNSIFQIQNFTAGKETPQRRYRHCLLQLRQKEQTVHECTFRRKRIDIDISEIKEKIESSEKYEKQRFEIDLEEKQYQLDSELTLIKDCLVEIAAYRKILEGLPEYTREEFEAAEQEYWKKRLLGDAKREIISTGHIAVQTIASLQNIGFLIGKNEDGHIIYERAPDDISPLCSSNSLGDKANDSQIDAPGRV